MRLYSGGSQLALTASFNMLASLEVQSRASGHAGALLTNHFRTLFPLPPVITPHDPFFRRATLHGARHVLFLRPRPCPSHFCSLTSGCHHLQRRRRWDQRRRRQQHRTLVLPGRMLSAQHVAAREWSTTTVLPLPPPKPPLTAPLALMLLQRFGFSRLRSWPSPAEGACTRLRRHDFPASRANFQRLDEVCGCHQAAAAVCLDTWGLDGGRVRV